MNINKEKRIRVVFVLENIYTLAMCVLYFLIASKTVAVPIMNLVFLPICAGLGAYYFALNPNETKSATKDMAIYAVIAATIASYPVFARA